MSLPFSQQVTADATCRLLQAGSGLAAQIAVTSVFTGQVWGAVAGTAGAIGMEALGRASGCYNNPDEDPNFPLPTPYFMTGCRKTANGDGELRFYLDETGELDTVIARQYREIVNIQFLRYSGTSITYYRLTWVTPTGTALTQDISLNARYRNTPPFADGKATSGSCEEQAPGTPPLWQPNTPIGPTYEFYDEETGCTWEIKPYDVYLDSKGQPVFHWKATSNDPATCGGPYEWWGNGQDPDIPQFEDPRGPDARPTPPTLPPGPGQDIKDDLDKIKEELEQLKECACPEEPVIQGQFRTISFRSDDTSPFGKSRLRTRLRYRGSEGVELSAVVDHWRDFSWESGPVRVQHLGASWGAPSVWAATADEGKRVLRHAGGEAGIDPDQVGRWKVGSSNNSRLGVSDTMRVDTTGGYYWITSRDGSDQRPIVAK